MSVEQPSAEAQDLGRHFGSLFNLMPDLQKDAQALINANQSMKRELESTKKALDKAIEMLGKADVKVSKEELLGAQPPKLAKVPKIVKKAQVASR